MPVPPITLVAFDLDDTLYPEREFVRSGFRVVSDYLVRRGIVDRPLFGALEAAFDAGVRGDTFNRVLEAAGVRPDPDLIGTLVDVYRSHRSEFGVVRPAIQLAVDARCALGDLRRRDLRLGLVSDGPLAAQEAKVEVLDLGRRFDAVVLTDTWGPAFWKPHPRGFRELAERLGVPPAGCVYVADNPAKDFAGPAAAGWRPSVRVRRPGGPHADAPNPADGSVAATIPDLGALAGLLDGLPRPRGRPGHA